MNIFKLENLVILASIMLVIFVLVLSVTLFLGEPEKTDLKQTACFRAASNGDCGILDDQLGEGTRDFCCVNYNKCC